MYSKRLRNKISSAIFVNKGSLREHKIAFHKKSKDGSGKADCYYTGNNQDKICGIIFEIDPNDKGVLDKYEGLGKGYDEKEVTVNCGDKTYKAQTYYANSSYIDKELRPYDWYLEFVIKGAEEYCLPLPYIESELKRIDAIVDSNEERKKMEYAISDRASNDDMNMGSFTVHDWKSLRKSLKDNTDYNSDWEQAIKWFNKRLNQRYLNPIKEISRKIDGVGFTIASMLCVLIEHLAAVREGKIHNYLKRGENPKYEYRQSDKVYRKFLGEARIFKGYFFAEDGSPAPFCADDFYKNVRCALLHEACTKNNWRINVSNFYSNPKNNLFIRDSQIKHIYRDVLLGKTIEYINSYFEELKESYDLRLNFARKMDNLCELTPDPQNYEWWVDN